MGWRHAPDYRQAARGLSTAALKRRLKVGMKIEVLAQNTRPALVGNVRTIVKVQGNGIAFTTGNDPGRSWLNWPTKGKATMLQMHGRVEYHGDEFSLIEEPETATSARWTFRILAA